MAASSKWTSRLASRSASRLSTASSVPPSDPFRHLRAHLPAQPPDPGSATSEIQRELEQTPSAAALEGLLHLQTSASSLHTHQDHSHRRSAAAAAAGGAAGTPPALGSTARSSAMHNEAHHTRTPPEGSVANGAAPRTYSLQAGLQSFGGVVGRPPDDVQSHAFSPELPHSPMLSQLSQTLSRISSSGMPQLPDPPLTALLPAEAAASTAPSSGVSGAVHAAAAERRASGIPRLRQEANLQKASSARKLHDSYTPSTLNDTAVTQQPPAENTTPLQPGGTGLSALPSRLLKSISLQGRASGSPRPLSRGSSQSPYTSHTRPSD